MKNYCLVFALFLAATPVAANEPQILTENARILYLKQVDMAIRDGRFTQAGQMISLLEQSTDGSFPEDLALLKAEFAIAHSDVQSADVALSAIKDASRNICRVQAAKGWVFVNQKAFDPAVTALNIATQNCPDDTGMWNLLGLALIGNGKATFAGYAFGRAMALEPGNAHIINNHALAALQEGAVDVALRELDGAVAQSPADTMIKANRNFVAGMAGLSPARAPGESDTDWSEKLLAFANGAKSASRGVQATALFSRAMLTLERFDEAVWSELNPPAGKAPQ